MSTNFGRILLCSDKRDIPQSNLKMTYSKMIFDQENSLSLFLIISKIHFRMFLIECWFVTCITRDYFTPGLLLAHSHFLKEFQDLQCCLDKFIYIEKPCYTKTWPAFLPFLLQFLNYFSYRQSSLKLNRSVNGTMYSQVRKRNEKSAMDIFKLFKYVASNKFITIG